MWCLSVGVHSGAAAGTGPSISSGRGEEQRAGQSRERQGPAGDKSAEDTTV